MSGYAQVRKGSKPEKLNASKCFPLCTLKADIALRTRYVRFVPRCDIDANDATATRTRTLIMAASWSGSAPAPQVRARYARRVGAKGPGLRQRRERWRAVGGPAFSSDPALERPR
jgi:hypothetical protein